MDRQIRRGEGRRKRKDLQLPLVFGVIGCDGLCFSGGQRRALSFDRGGAGDLNGPIAFACHLLV